ncbi:MAG: hypothetical protein AAF985_16620 [Bacteroidota bacterium]
MDQYKVIFQPNTLLPPKGVGRLPGRVDGLTAAVELEALITEKAKEGYELVSIIPNIGNINEYGYACSVTVGYMVTFCKKAKD